jgi:hypothetical protein
MLKLSKEEIDIFGRPNFACAQIAKILIECGHYEDKAKTAEYEQAVFIHWATGLLKKHGPHWKSQANEILRTMVNDLRQQQELKNNG